MARRYKPLPAGQVVWLQIWGRTAEVITDDGAGLVYLLERVREYDYQVHVARGRIRPATDVEAANHSLQVAHIMDWRRDEQTRKQVQAVRDELAAAAGQPSVPADPAG